VVCAAGCALVALAWLRPWAGVPDLMLMGLIGYYLALMMLLILGIIVAREVGPPWRYAALGGAVTLVVYGAFPIMGPLPPLDYLVARIGAYAIPRFPGPIGEYVPAVVMDGLGALVCLSTFVFGALSLRHRERATPLVIGSCLVALFVVLTAFVYDRVTHSPYAVVRAYLIATSRGDEDAIKAFLSADSLADWSELRIAAAARPGTSAATAQRARSSFGRRALISGLETEGGQATVMLGIPRHWEVGHFRGRGSRMYLVNEEGRWRVDAHRDYREMRELVRSQSPEGED
jgi:hypothetical protein